MNESCCGDFREMFMLGDGKYLLFCEAAHAYAVFERDHVAIPDEPLRTKPAIPPVDISARRIASGAIAGAVRKKGIRANVINAGGLGDCTRGLRCQKIEPVRTQVRADVLEGRVPFGAPWRLAYQRWSADGRRCLRVRRCSTGFIFRVTTHSFRFRQFLFFNREY